MIIIALSQCLAKVLIFPLAIYNFFSWRPHEVTVLCKKIKALTVLWILTKQKDTKPNYHSVIQLCHDLISFQILFLLSFRLASSSKHPMGSLACYKLSSCTVSWALQLLLMNVQRLEQSHSWHLPIHLVLRFLHFLQVHRCLV